MPLPRIRFTIRSLMVVILAAAGMLALARGWDALAVLIPIGSERRSGVGMVVPRG